MYRLVASDMDETFLHHSNVIPEGNIAALARMKELGVLFVPCSGRAYNSIAKNLQQIDQSLLENTYVISCNGGFINRYGDPEPLTRCGLAFESANEIYKRGRELGMCMHVCFANGTYNCFNPTDKELAFLSPYPSVNYYDRAEHESIDFLESHDIVKTMYMSDDFEGLMEIGESMRPWAAELGAEITFSSNRYMEFMPAGINKGVGIKNLCEILGIDISETIAIGDAANDIGMFKAAGLGVGVANVTDDAREHCDVVLETSGFDGALPEFVERILEP